MNQQMPGSCRPGALMVLLHWPWAGEAKLGLAEPAGLMGGSPGGPQTRCLGAGHSGTGLKSWSAWCGAGILTVAARSDWLLSFPFPP